VPVWNDLGVAFNTLREIDVAAIRAESERPVTIIGFGARRLVERAAALLRLQGVQRYGPAGADPIVYRPLSAAALDEEVRRADLLLIVLDARAPLAVSEAATLARLADLALPTTIVIVGASVANPGPPRPEFAHAHIMTLPELAAATANQLASSLIERLPGEKHLAAARRLPGLRHGYARDLVGAVSFANATYALSSAIPEQIPALALPFVVADIIVLTKNQSLMVYRLALAHGAEPEFSARMREILPVIGGGFLWRQTARSLASLIPIWGVVPKVAIAYAGTYTTGVAAWRWFADSEILSRARLEELSNEAMRLGRERAQALVEAARRRTAPPDEPRG